MRRQRTSRAWKGGRSRLSEGAKQRRSIQWEAKIQEGCVTWFRLQHPTRMIFSIPNGGTRRAYEVYRMKGQGLLPGVPDLMIPEPTSQHSGLFVEMKRKGGQTSQEQVEIMSKLKKRGYSVATCTSIGAFVSVVGEYFDNHEEANYAKD